MSWPPHAAWPPGRAGWRSPSRGSWLESRSRPPVPSVRRATSWQRCCCACGARSTCCPSCRPGWPSSRCEVASGSAGWPTAHAPVQETNPLKRDNQKHVNIVNNRRDWSAGIQHVTTFPQRSIATRSHCVTRIARQSHCVTSIATVTLCNQDCHTVTLCNQDCHTVTLCNQDCHTVTLCNQDCQTVTLCNQNCQTVTLCNQDCQTVTLCNKDCQTVTLCNQDCHTVTLCN